MPTNELPTNELPTNEMPKSGYVPVVSPTIPNTNPNNISYLSDLEFQIIMGLIRSNINNFDNKYDPKDVSKRYGLNTSMRKGSVLTLRCSSSLSRAKRSTLSAGTGNNEKEGVSAPQIELADGSKPSCPSFGRFALPASPFFAGE